MTDEKPPNSLLRSAVFGLGGVLAGIAGTFGTQIAKDEYFPPTKSAKIGQICLEAGISRGKFLRSSGAERQLQSEAGSLLNRMGFMATPDLEITGYKRSGANPVIVRGVVLNARSGARLPDSEALVQGRTVEASASTIRRAPSVWFPMPTQPGRYVFRVQVNEPAKPTSETVQRLAQRDGPQFDVLGGGRIRLNRPCSGT